MVIYFLIIICVIYLYYIYIQEWHVNLHWWIMIMNYSIPQYGQPTNFDHVAQSKLIWDCSDCENMVSWCIASAARLPVLPWQLPVLTMGNQGSTLLAVTGHRPRVSGCSTGLDCILREDSSSFSNHRLTKRPWIMSSPTIAQGLSRIWAGMSWSEHWYLRSQ